MTRQQIERLIQQIEHHFQLGREILKQCGSRSPRGLIQQLAREYRLNRDTCQKLRALAAPETGYTRSELNTWLRRFRSQQHALSVSHFVKLVSVPKGPERDRLTQRCLDEKWSSHRLQVEIIAACGRRRQGGRKPSLADSGDFAAKLQHQVWSWQRWLDLHLETIDLPAGDLRREIRSLRRKLGTIAGLLESRGRE